jgi:hypothetical protein
MKGLNTGLKFGLATGYWRISFLVIILKLLLPLLPFYRNNYCWFYLLPWNRNWEPSISFYNCNFADTSSIKLLRVVVGSEREI